MSARKTLLVAAAIGWFVAGSAVAVVSQALGLGLFSGEGGLRVVIVALLAGAWALASLVVMALVLGMRKNAPECTGTDSQTAREAAPAKDIAI